MAYPEGESLGMFKHPHGQDRNGPHPSQSAGCMTPELSPACGRGSKERHSLRGPC